MVSLLFHFRTAILTRGRGGGPICDFLYLTLKELYMRRGPRSTHNNNTIKIQKNYRRLTNFENCTVPYRAKHTYIDVHFPNVQSCTTGMSQNKIFQTISKQKVVSKYLNLKYRYFFYIICICNCIQKAFLNIAIADYY